MIRLGGSVLASPLSSDLLRQYAKLLSKLRGEGHEVGVVTGGGAYARDYIRVASDLGLASRQRDQIAISVSRVNAKLFMYALGLEGDPPKTVASAARYAQDNGIVVMGGLRPGMTTDYVAFLLARSMGSNLLLKATDQEGIYDKDPRSFKDAKLQRRLSYEELSKIIEATAHTPGIHSILDPIIVRALPGSGIAVRVFNGKNPDNLLKIMSGEDVGTYVGPP